MGERTDIAGLIERLEAHLAGRPLVERVERLAARFEAQAIGLMKVSGTSPQVVENIMRDALTMHEAAMRLRTLETEQ